jgi:hypothetical protein
MATKPITQSFRQERDTKERGKFRCSVIFTWSNREGEDVFPDELPLLINDKVVVYKREG